LTVGSYPLSTPGAMQGRLGRSQGERMSTINSASADAVSGDQIAELSAAAVQVSRNDPTTNPRELINAELIKEQKARVRYRNGVTLPTAASVLLANAARKDYNHRRRLSDSIRAATKQPRPAATCAHHIVAHLDQAAGRSRLLLFRWGIGINDADNGVFLPAKQVGMSGFPNAVHHMSYHQPEYHFAVYVRLVRRSNGDEGRTELRSMKSDLLAGRMSL